MPPLRERRDDIPHLVDHFLDKHRFTPGAPPARITDDAMDALIHHDWPGNVRELENTVERAVVLAQGDVITVRHLLLTPSSINRIIDVEERVARGVSLPDTIADVEKQMIAEALKQASGNRSTAAKKLGIYRRLLYAKLKEYGIEN